MYRIIAVMRTLALAGVLAPAACVETSAPEPRMSPATAAFHTEAFAPIVCPTDTSRSASALLGVLGGLVTIDRHALDVPFQAITVLATFSLTTPVSQYLELDIRANDNEHFNFRKPVSITIDYSRCDRSATDSTALVVWQIDPATKAPIERMGGVDDKDARTITFSTDHLSTYTIAQ